MEFVEREVPIVVSRFLGARTPNAGTSRQEGPR
jgi:hypothetical protein